MNVPAPNTAMPPDAPSPGRADATEPRSRRPRPAPLRSRRSPPPVGSRCLVDLEEASSNPVALVDGSGAPIATDQLGAVVRCGRRHQRVVGGAATHRSLGQCPQEIPVGPGAHTQKRPRKARPQELADDPAGGSMWSRQAREHRVGLERAVFDEAQVAVQSAPRGVVALVSGREGGDHHAGIGGGHRRTRSRVSRT